MKHLYLGLSVTFFLSVMILTLKHSPFFVACVQRETKARNPSLFAPQATAGPFVQKLMSFALCCYVISLFNSLQPNHKHNGKECGWVVSSHFFGGSVAWHPKKWLLWRLLLSATKISLFIEHRVVYKRRQPAKFAGFSARFWRLLSLLHKSRYVEEMMFIRSQNRLLFTKLQLLKNFTKMLWTIKVLQRDITLTK